MLLLQRSKFLDCTLFVPLENSNGRITVYTTNELIGAAQRVLDTIKSLQWHSYEVGTSIENNKDSCSVCSNSLD